VDHDCPEVTAALKPTKNVSELTLTSDHCRLLPDLQLTQLTIDSYIKMLEKLQKL